MKEKAKMDRRDPDVVAIVKKLKERARASPWVPIGLPPREHYHNLSNGLHLCLTIDILSKEYMNQLARATRWKLPEEAGEGSQFWHLTIARLGRRGPSTEEVRFWRQAFFEEEPALEVPGLITGVKTSHFFWRAE